jgi:predicted ATPase
MAFIMNFTCFRENIFTHTSNWCVITGAPCSGKTTVVESLAEMGYQTMPEVARRYLETEIAKGRTLAQIKSDELLFERHILEEKRQIEAGLPLGERIFFDRGIPDSIAYYRQAGLDISDPVRLSRRSRYHRVFLLERLPFKDDPIRVEDDDKARALHHYILESYAMLGYEPIHIPVLPLPERIKRILGYLSEEHKE